MDVKIRPLIREDAFKSYKWRNDPDVFKYTGNTYKNEITIETELNWIERVILNKDEYRCAIIADNNYVGNIYLTDISEGKATYHIFIGDKSYWGKGIAQEASLQIIDYAKTVLHLHSINLRVKKSNSRAFELYKRLGFVEHEENEDWIYMTKDLSYID